MNREPLVGDKEGLLKLPTDKALLEDPVFRSLVEKYAMVSHRPNLPEPNQLTPTSRLNPDSFRVERLPGPPVQATPRPPPGEHAPGLPRLSRLPGSSCVIELPGLPRLSKLPGHPGASCSRVSPG
ncbi:hypothetical protein L6452_32837 [Arctium lappa]|uniref:Uncharacterized protein n=1 Tax=Arctium lappa TaxID=4217 RepID=A0ACB8ZA21_ARCLA|nr:hypothetical protein L6452_32837 [Arctium lappa]